MNSALLVKIDEDLKERVARLAKREGRNTSEVVRELLAEYLKERDISSYIESLWTRIGDRIREEGFTEKDVAKAIADYRKSK